MVIWNNGMEPDSRTQDSAPKTHLLFVYGTLKRNEPNHHLILDPTKGKAVFKGMAKTVQKWPLVIASRYNIPYLLFKEGEGKHIVGELYSMDDAMLSVMDELECHPEYYTRLEMPVQCFADTDKDLMFPLQSTATPWMYFLMNFKDILLELPFLENYSSKGAHGLEYVSRYTRPSNEGYYADVQIVD